MKFKGEFTKLILTNSGKIKGLGSVPKNGNPTQVSIYDEATNATYIRTIIVNPKTGEHTLQSLDHKLALSEICTDFEQISTKIDSEMFEEGGMWWANIPSANKYRVIKGFMQSRKTWAIITTALYYLFQYSFTTFIVVQNSIDARTQMVDRLSQILVKMGYSPSDYIGGSEKKAISGKRPKIFVILRNSSDILPLNQVLEKVEIPRYVTIIDESDYNDSATTAKVQEGLELFKDQSICVYDVTATPLTTLMKEEIECRNVITLGRPDGYKGVPSIQCFQLPKPAMYCSSTLDDPFLKDQNLIKYIQDFSKTNPFTSTEWGIKQTHPRYTLVRLGSTIQPQLRIASYVEKNYNDSILAITYNGSLHGITLRGSALPLERIVLNDGSTSTVDDNRVHHFKQGLHIGKIITWLMENGGAYEYPRIMVLAGALADRGISFGSDNYSDCIARKIIPWHLTEMYFVCAKSMTQPNLLQAVGRLCGVFPDNIPLVLYTNSSTDVIKCFGAQEELIERSLKCDQDTFKDAIALQSMSREKLCKRRLTATRVPCKVERVENDFVYGGFDWNAEGYVQQIDEAKFSNGTRPTLARSVVTDQERERLRSDIEVLRKKEQEKLNDVAITKGIDKVRRAYRKSTSMVHKIVKLFIDNSFGSATIEQLRKATSDTFEIANYDRWELGKHNRYKIVSQTKNKKYILCPEIVDALGLMN
jgi:hypothetical protein